MFKSDIIIGDIKKMKRFVDCERWDTQTLEGTPKFLNDKLHVDFDYFTTVIAVDQYFNKSFTKTLATYIKEKMFRYNTKVTKVFVANLNFDLVDNKVKLIIHKLHQLTDRQIYEQYKETLQSVVAIEFSKYNSRIHINGATYKVKFGRGVKHKVSKLNKLNQCNSLVQQLDILENWIELDIITLTKVEI